MVRTRTRPRWPPAFFACSPLTRGITSQGVPADKWKTEPVNKDFRVCATYPEVLTVPANASQEMIEQVGGRDACRLFTSLVPLLSHFHQTTPFLSLTPPLALPGCRVPE